MKLYGAFFFENVTLFLPFQKQITQKKKILSWNGPAIIAENIKAKIDLSLLNETDRKDGKLVLVTAITPTAAGEGKIILHCYAGNLEFLEKFLEIGSYIGVTGMVTFPKSHNIRENLRNIPDDRLLFETDAPYLAPVPFRGKPNHPALVAHTVEYAARFLDKDPEQLAKQTPANALKVFGLEK